MGKAGFERLIERRPERVRRLSNRRPPPATLVTLAVVPISKNVPLAEFCQRLTAAFSRYGETLHLNGQRVDDQLETGAAQSELHDGEFWRRQRRMMQPSFHRNQIATMTEKITAAGERLLTRWATYEPDKPIEIADEMMDVTLATEYVIRFLLVKLWQYV